MLRTSPGSSSTPARIALFAALLAAPLLVSTPALSQSVIKRPGDHPDYSVELEPHFVLQWSNRFGGSEGIGPGFRANIPFLDNGPVPSINNNMAISFGLDVTFGDNDCRWWWNRYDRNSWLAQANCSTTEFWAPVTVQWNFFLTKMISVFGEPGLAIVHRRWDWEWWCGAPDGAICEYDDTDTGVDFVFWAGGRFMFSETFGATVRLGHPSLTVGINFLM